MDPDTLVQRHGSSDGSGSGSTPKCHGSGSISSKAWIRGWIRIRIKTKKMCHGSATLPATRWCRPSSWGWRRPGIGSGGRSAQRSPLADTAGRRGWRNACLSSTAGEEGRCSQTSLIWLTPWRAIKGTGIIKNGFFNSWSAGVKPSKDARTEPDGHYIGIGQPFFFSAMKRQMYFYNCFTSLN